MDEPDQQDKSGKKQSATSRARARLCEKINKFFASLEKNPLGHFTSAQGVERSSPKE